MTRLNAPRSLLPLAAALLLVCLRPVTEAAADPHPVGPHGGTLVPVEDVRCEVVAADHVVRVWLFDHLGKPIDAADIRGTLTLQYAGNPRRYHYPLYPETTRNSPGNVLVSERIRSDRLDDEVAPRFALYGLNGLPRQSVTFTATFRSDAAALQQAIAQQTVCPVSGRALTTRATLWNVPVDSQSVFVCCESCIDEVQEHSEQYLMPPVPTDTDQAAPTSLDRR